MNFQKNPAVWIGIIGSIIVFAIEQFVGGGVITQDAGESATNIVQAALPVVLSLITRSFVWSPHTIAAILLALQSKDIGLRVAPTEASAMRLAKEGKELNPDVTLG